MYLISIQDRMDSYETLDGFKDLMQDYVENELTSRMTKVVSLMLIILKI